MIDDKCFFNVFSNFICDWFIIVKIVDIIIYDIFSCLLDEII